MEKELKHLSRAELLELLIAQMEDNENLKEKLAVAEAKLLERQMAIDKAGSIAEAALSLSGIFEAAEEASKQYMENIERLSGDQERICRDMVMQAEQQAAAILADAEASAKKSRADAEAYWRLVVTKAQEILKHPERSNDWIRSDTENTDT